MCYQQIQNKRLSREDRLNAHRERKRYENRYRDKFQQWKEVSKSKNIPKAGRTVSSSGTKKVKERDALRKERLELHLERKRREAEVMERRYKWEDPPPRPQRKGKNRKNTKNTKKLLNYATILPERDLVCSTKDKALWILHFNPFLGDSLLKNGQRLKCWMETKDPDEKNKTRVMIGFLEYSGDLAHAKLEGIDKNAQTRIGSECIRMTDIKGYVLDYNEVEMRTRQSIEEVQLAPQHGIPLTGEDAVMSTKDFLQNCNDRIDVIFDPQSTGDWFPFREADTLRKIAPQFRSKGVGYMRLGDDMGKNGRAFISNDGCKSFFSNYL